MREHDLPRVASTAIAFGMGPLVWLSGCGSSGPPPAVLPAVNPRAAAAEAIDLYDSNGDGLLSGSELASCPAISNARDRYDADGDGQVSQDEIAARLTQIFTGRVGLLTVDCRVTRGDRPLSGAKVRFIPEPFLGGAVESAFATTDANGAATPSISRDKLPPQLGSMQMMQPGLYRVEIEHPSLSPGDHVSLGCEVDPSRRDDTTVRFDL